ncbi:MAG: hypothetical protein AABY07_01200 [Nanoarchaeota archaeon]
MRERYNTYEEMPQEYLERMAEQANFIDISLDMVSVSSLSFLKKLQETDSAEDWHIAKKFLGYFYDYCQDQLVCERGKGGSFKGCREELEKRKNVNINT